MRPAIDDSPPSLSPYLSVPLRTSRRKLAGPAPPLRPRSTTSSATVLLLLFVLVLLLLVLLISREVSFAVISLLFFRLRKSLAAYLLHLFLLLGRRYFGAGHGLHLADVSPTSFPRNVRAGSAFNFSPGLT